MEKHKSELITIDSDTDDKPEVINLESDSEEDMPIRKSDKSKKRKAKGTSERKVRKVKVNPVFGPFGKDIVTIAISEYKATLVAKKKKKGRNWTDDDDDWLRRHTHNLNQARQNLDLNYKSEEEVRHARCTISKGCIFN
jgi:hypothetical protein